MEKKLILTNCEEETKAVAKELAERLAPGSVVCLRGDLGVGKTIFSKGLCHALGVTEQVSSPTFTIVNEYDGASLPIYHFDLYRIEDSDELYEIGFTEFLDAGGISIIEWPERGEDILPKNRIEVRIERAGEDSRNITIEELSA